jgi:excisionase family DNA binding protein
LSPKLKEKANGLIWARERSSLLGPKKGQEERRKRPNSQKGGNDRPGRLKQRLVPKAMEKGFLNIKEVSEYLGIKKSSLYSRVEKKEIPHYRVGRLIRFKKSEIDPWMEKFKSEPLDLHAEASRIPKDVTKDSIDVDAIVNKNIEKAKGLNYTPNPGRSDRIKGLGKEV